jgi:hypothetical protein
MYIRVSISGLMYQLPSLSTTASILLEGSPSGLCYMEVSQGLGSLEAGLPLGRALGRSKSPFLLILKI